jgi:uncharacterized membrane protein
MVRILPALFYFILAFVLGTLSRAFRQFFIQPYLGYRGALVAEAIAILVVIVIGIVLMQPLLAHEKRFGSRAATVIVAVCCVLFAGAAFIDIISFIPMRFRAPIFPFDPIG